MGFPHRAAETPHRTRCKSGGPQGPGLVTDPDPISSVSPAAASHQAEGPTLSIDPPHLGRSLQQEPIAPALKSRISRTWWAGGWGVSAVRQGSIRENTQEEKRVDV